MEYTEEESEVEMESEGRPKKNYTTIAEISL